MTRAPAAAGVALGLALLLGGCAVPAAERPGLPADSGTAGTLPERSTAAGPGSAAPSAPAGTPPTAAVRPDAAPSGVAPSGVVPSGVTPSGWQTFTTSDGLSFDYPPGWTARDPGGALDGAFVDVTNADGKPMAQLRTNIVTGAECTAQYPYEVYDSEPLQALAEPGSADRGAPRYVYESRGDGTGPAPDTTAAYGITMMPEETGPLACPMFHLFLWPPSGALFGGTYNPAANLTPGEASLPYLEKAKRYAATPEYRMIRTMITSLRPAIKPAK